MSNGMPSWDEWDNLTEDQRNYKKYEVLVSVTRHLAETCPKRIDICNAHFAKLDKRKWWDRGAALAGGFASGLLGALGIKWGG